MTPEQERALLKAVRLGLEQDLLKAFEKLKGDIRKGIAPRDAVDTAMISFAGKYESIMKQAFSELLTESLDPAAAGNPAMVGEITLSQNIYTQANKLAVSVEKVIQNHVKGYQDARGLAKQLYEGYDAEGTEVLTISKSNPRIPKYMKESVLSTGDTGAIKRTFARLQAKGLKTSALNAAYQGVLDALENSEKGAGADLLDKKLKVAFYEKGRFYANRVAQTELHRSYGLTEAANLTGDDDVEFVQIRRSGASGVSCICDMIAGADSYGLGAGVYPKALTPVPPYHPFCRCVMSPRLDLTGKIAKAFDEAAGKKFASSPNGNRIIGNQKLADRVKAGENPLAVINENRPTVYKIRTIAETTGG